MAIFEILRNLSQAGIFGLLASVRPRSTLGCWGTWNRTKINSFKGYCPTVRRSPNVPYSAIKLRYRQEKTALATRRGLLLYKWVILQYRSTGSSPCDVSLALRSTTSFVLSSFVMNIFSNLNRILSPSSDDTPFTLPRLPIPDMLASYGLLLRYPR